MGGEMEVRSLGGEERGRKWEVRGEAGEGWPHTKEDRRGAARWTAGEEARTTSTTLEPFRKFVVSLSLSPTRHCECF